MKLTFLAAFFFATNIFSMENKNEEKRSACCKIKKLPCRLIDISFQELYKGDLRTHKEIASGLDSSRNFFLSRMNNVYVDLDKTWEIITKSARSLLESGDAPEFTNLDAQIFARKALVDQLRKKFFKSKRLLGGKVTEKITWFTEKKEVKEKFLKKQLALKLGVALSKEKKTYTPSQEKIIPKKTKKNQNKYQRRRYFN